MFFDNLLKFLIVYCTVLISRASCNLIFANSKDLRMVYLDSPRLDTSVIVDNLGDATALDFYHKEQIVFWSDLATEKIQGIRLGNKSKKPFEVINSGLSSPDGLGVDWLTKKLYWSDSDTKRIEVCQFDGKNRKVLFWKDIDAPRAIALVPQEGLLFWTDWGDKPKIERASMDGKHRFTLINEELRWPNGLAVDYDARRIYWVDGKLKYISSADYDGNNRKKIVSNLPHTFGLTLEKDMLYMTDWTNMGISSCNKVSEKCKILLPSLKHQSNQLYPMGIKVLSPLLQPESTTGCDINNGGCSHLCLLSSDPSGYSCACPTGVLLTADNKTCAKGEEKFIVLLRKTDIRKISLDTDDHTDVVLPYPKEIKHAIAIDYDPIEGRIYWTDDDAKAIRRAYLNSSNLDNVISSNLSHPDGIAVDWIARNLYWTDTGSNTIQISRLDGSYRKTLISSQLDEPRAIVINPWKALMFWTDWGSEPKIERASLDGSNREKIVYKDIVWPNGLAIDLDEERLFWGDAKTDCIETCDYNGGSRKLLLNHVSHPFGLTVLDDYVYWTDWHERAIHRTNKRTGGKREIFVDLLPDMMGLKAISIHQNLGLDLDLGCYKFNGGCKQLCLDRHQKPFTCSCANGWELDFDDKSCKRIKVITPPPFSRNDRKILPISPITNPKKPCPTDRIACISGEIDCIDPSHRCDGDKDCTDGSDEADCSACPSGKIQCPSDPGLCLDEANLCDKYSPCTDLTPELIGLCAKFLSPSSSTSSPSSKSSPSPPSLSSSVSSSASLPAAPPSSSAVNILSSNGSLPIFGVLLALFIIILIFYFAYKATTGIVQPINKEQPFAMPLMQQNHLSLQGSQCTELRTPIPPNSLESSVILSIPQATPDLLLSYPDTSRLETNSQISGYESVTIPFPYNPPPSPATTTRSSNKTYKT